MLWKLLAWQVVAFADSLKGADGLPLVHSAHISSNTPLPRETPDIVVVTPGALINTTDDYGQYVAWEWTKSGIVTRSVPCLEPSLSGKVQVAGAVAEAVAGAKKRYSRCMH